jgi:adenylate kinase/UMP-CMP kinase
MIGVVSIGKQCLLEIRHALRLFAGGPGSGKGTQCDRIKAKYGGVVHLSAGDLLRDEVKSGSEVGKACNALMVEGKLVPVNVTIMLLRNAMIKSGGKVFLIDGFPR